MTVAALTPEVTYLADGTTEEFAVPFKFDAGTLEVATIAADGSVDEQTEGSQYEATGGTTDAGGLVTMSNPPADGLKLRIRRGTARAQQSNYVTNDDFPSETHEAGLDRLMMIAQEQDAVMADTVARAVMVPEGETVGRLPTLADRKGKALTFDAATGDPEATAFSTVYDGTQTLIAENRTVLAALTGMSAGQSASMTEAERAGLFVWSDDDLSDEVAVDTQQGIYVAPASDPTGASGAWVRQLPSPNSWHADMFGIPHDPANGNGGVGEVQCHAEFTAMVNLANLLKPNSISFADKVYTLGAAIPAWTYQMHLIGGRGGRSSIIVKRYVEADAQRGVLAFSDFGFTLDRLTVLARAGSGGSLISIILSAASAAAGRAHLLDVYASGFDYVNYSLYVDGSINTTPAGPSYRGLFIRGGEFFGAALASMKFKSLHHLFIAGTFMATSGGSSTLVLDSDGDAVAYNDDWQIHGLVAGAVNLNRLSRAVIVSPQTANITVDANANAVMWVGPRWAGLVINSAGAGFVHNWDAMVTARGGNSAAGWMKFGNGKIFQWGSATTDGTGLVSDQTLPLAFTSSNIQYSGQNVASAGADSLTIANLYPGTNVLTQYTLKAANINTSTDTAAPAAVTVRWTANGT